MPVYLDCNATSPTEPAVQEAVIKYLRDEFGNAGSRTHQFGARAKKAVQEARDQVAAVVVAKREEVVFTSGATESNNLAILGLASTGREQGRTHLVTTEIEHKAVLEPMEVLGTRGFEVSYVAPGPGGRVDPGAILSAVRPETLLVSVAHVNNETGVIQPIAEIADGLDGIPAYFHVDAAQGFGKRIEDLRNNRIDLMSVSAHKVYGPKGIGALVARRRGYEAAPLEPLSYGGGQERGLRPGTLPVPQIVGFGIASALALKNSAVREKTNLAFRERLWKVLESLGAQVNGDPDHVVPTCLNVSFPGIDSEAAIVALKDLVAISNGSACTSQSYEPSHVLTAMGLEEDRVQGALRLSWCHMTEEPDWVRVAEAIHQLQ
jgi:cysteine desulfurase